MASKRKRVEEVLGGDEERFRRLAEKVRLIWWEADAKTWGFTHVGPQAADILGYPLDDWYRLGFWVEHIHPEDREWTVKYCKERSATEANYECEYRMFRVDGRVIWLHDIVNVVRDDHGPRTLRGFMIDITERKRAEALQAGQHRVLELLTTGSSLSDVLTELAHTIEEQAPGMLCSILIVEPAGDRLCHGTAPNLPAEYTRAIDGVPIGPAVGSCGTAAYRGERVVVKDVRTDPLWTAYRDVALKHNLRACWSQPILSADGGVLGTFAMYYREPRAPNASELSLIEKAANLAGLAIERNRAEEALRRSERIASIGTLAAGIAHEINNPIAAILLAAQHALSAKDPREQSRRAPACLNGIVHDAERCGRIVQSVLQFSRLESIDDWPIDVNDCVRTAAELTRKYAEQRGATIELELVEHLPRAHLNPVHIEQVVVNLIRNAVESADAGIRVQIHTELISGTIRIQVCDNGRGMTSEQKNHLFDPFFTTRVREGGTGLGLSITHGIVVSHGGTIDVQSELGRGTIISVELPIGRISSKPGANTTPGAASNKRTQHARRPLR